jgi:hypothetical protein
MSSPVLRKTQKALGSANGEEVVASLRATEVYLTRAGLDVGPIDDEIHIIPEG